MQSISEIQGVSEKYSSDLEAFRMHKTNERGVSTRM